MASGGLGAPDEEGGEQEEGGGEEDGEGGGGGAGMDEQAEQDLSSIVSAVATHRLGRAAGRAGGGRRARDGERCGAGGRPLPAGMTAACCAKLAKQLQLPAKLVTERFAEEWGRRTAAYADATVADAEGSGSGPTYG
jgi:hypothetical protein